MTMGENFGPRLDLITCLGPVNYDRGWAHEEEAEIMSLVLCAVDEGSV